MAGTGHSSWPLTVALRATAAAGAAALIAACGSIASPAQSAGRGATVLSASTATISETGSSLLAPQAQAWATAYEHANPGVTVSTKSTSSGIGIAAAEAGSADIGASDAYLSSGDVVQSPTLLNIALTVSAQTVIYNLPSLSPGTHVTLDGAVLAEIYDGAITMWDDSKIAALNKGLTLPPEKIVPLERTGSSGDTFLFTSYLSTQDPAWNSSLGYGTSVAWPYVPGARPESSSTAMLDDCKATPGCIGYNGISFLSGAVAGNLGYAALKNNAGNPTLPTTAAIQAAVGSAFGGWVATLHSSAAHSLVSVDEPLSLDARQMYQAVADADATITATFLASSEPSLVPLQRYQNDIAAAATDLSRLRSGTGSPAAGSALAALSGGLPLYTAYVAKAQAEYAMGFPLTGGSFLQVASEEAHLVLLPAANTVFTQENAALSAASSDASDWITLIAALLLAVITGTVLYRAQRWLTRRTNRTFSIGLVLASVLLIVSVAWLAAGFLTARSDLGRGFGSGSDPAENLALASIGVQQIRGDAVLNVISRSGNASFTDDFAATSKKVGPGSGTWLGAAAAAQQPGGQGAALVAAAEQEATAWYAANSQVYSLGDKAEYAAERTSVIATGSGGTATGYDTLEGRIEAAINADQGVFQAAASAGASALSPLAGVVIAGSLLMAACCAWGISRRLAEYR